jgi:short-chain fatty acids transporter
VNSIIDFFVRLFLRWITDAFVVALVLSLLTFGLAITVAGFGVVETLNSWGDGFWNLLRFTNQITLTLLLGYALANTPPVRAGLAQVAGYVNTPTVAYSVACLITGVCALVSWGLSLIVAGIVSRSIGESCRTRGVAVHYPLLVASAFSGFVVWHQGLSSSVGLTIATPGHFLEAQIGIIDTSQTLFNLWNAGLAVIVLALLPFVMVALHPRAARDVSEIPEHLVSSNPVPNTAPEEAERLAAYTPAERLERSRLLSMLMIGFGVAFVWTHAIVRGEGLTLNIFNFTFLFAGLLLAGSPIRYVQIIVEGGRVAAPFLLQYPFYAGIAAVMADSGLAEIVIGLFVQVSSPVTLPLFAFLSGGVLNIFIPSGGGQWAVQGPIMMSAALEVGANVPRVAMAVALGDQWTNLIQPLSIVPVITIAQVPLREIMGYCFFALIFSGVLFSVALLVF